MSTIIINPSSFSGASSSDATITFVGQYSSTSNSTSYTFVSADIGSAEYLLLSPVGQVTGSISLEASSITAGGDSATELATGAWIVAAPVDTTPSVVVTFSQSQQNAGVAVWGLTNITDASAAVDTDSGTSATDTLSLTVSAGGVVHIVAAADSYPTFTYGSNVTKNFESSLAKGYEFSGASAAFANAQSPLSVAIDISGASIRRYRAISLR